MRGRGGTETKGGGRIERRLEEAEKEYQRQKELEWARQEKWKVVEMEESREEMRRSHKALTKK
jgi:hypothetical protein